MTHDICVTGARTDHTPAPPYREWATVGEWARDVADAHCATPREVQGADGRWRHNPERVRTGQRAHDARVAVAYHGGFPLDEVGACGRCAALCHRYGDGGNPLCPTCLAKVRAADAAARAARAGGRG